MEWVVRRLRFTVHGEPVQESTFATEAELAGIRPTQATFDFGEGKRDEGEDDQG